MPTAMQQPVATLPPLTEDLLRLLHGLDRAQLLDWIADRYHEAKDAEARGYQQQSKPADQQELIVDLLLAVYPKLDRSDIRKALAGQMPFLNSWAVGELRKVGAAFEAVLTKADQHGYGHGV